MVNLGEIIREARENKLISQKELCESLCSQSALSEIEANKYAPSKQLLIQICKRLSISSTDLCLQQNYKVSKCADFNRIIKRLYNSSDYRGLRNFLNRPTLLNSVQTSQQTQAYYFYLAICSIQLDLDLDNAKAFLKLSLASSGKRHKRSTLTRLGNAALALIYAKLDLKNSAQTYFDLAMHNLDKDNYDGNQNTLFFIGALIYSHFNDYNKALDIIEQGLKRASTYKSNFMLINLFYLMAHITETLQTHQEFKDETIYEYLVANILRQKLMPSI
ncbi:helix-turn-helix domain-containing protein [Companilactobacillus sp. HBUAS59544]|uniref:helix-turn-helix domain-containing protein n=1 Tax=Companilactobacillus sp. HBUAS59544 TaxID=3109363 RepID=UPI002FF38368